MIPRPKPELSLNRDNGLRSWEAIIAVDRYYGVVALCSDNGSLRLEVFSEPEGRVAELVIDKKFLESVPEEA